MNNTDKCSVSHNLRTRANSINNSAFVVGISPQYWAYTPLLVIDVLNLKLKDGINWLKPSLSNTRLSTPVSKCLLVGHIVYATERRGGSKLYILDDGTGVIDCVHWSNSNSSNILNPYYLPSLTDPLNDQGHQKSFSVGEPVRVFGKIECLASISKSPHAYRVRTNDRTQSNKFVVREIQVQMIERVQDYLVSEARHWVDSCEHIPSNLFACMDALGPQLNAQIENRINLPAADDTTSSWRVFGMSCSCRLSYMEDLLYCHCQCTPETLDPFYRFRDALLDKLLSMQTLITKELQFKYKEIRNNHLLQTMASNEVMVKKTTEKNKLIDKLFLKTFSALRCDGIIYLLNSNTDEYLLITRGKVLEPFIRSKIKNEMESFNATKNFFWCQGAPRFISKVHNERLLYIKRLMSLKKI